MSSTPTSPPYPRHLLFALLVLLAIAVFHHPLAVLIGSSLAVDQYSHVLLVLPVSLALLYSARSRILADAAFSAAGGILLLLLVAVFLLTRHYSAGLSPNDSLSLSLFFFVSLCLAAFVLCYGRGAFRAACFPLLFLFLMVPLPDAVLAQSIAFLQHGSAEATALLFQFSNVPFTRNGVVLLLPKATIEIAQECSGIRSSLVLLITSLILGHLFLRSGWTKAALALAVVPLTIAKNGLRIFVLSILGMYADPSFLSGSLHRKGGILFFALSFACLLVFIRLLQKLERRPEDAETKSVPAGATLLP